MRSSLTKDWYILDTREKHHEKIASLDSLTIDPTRTTLGELKKLRELQPNILEEENAILELRKVKTKEEIEKITASQRVNEKALENVVRSIRTGITEKEIEKLIKIEYLKLGAQ